MKLLVTGASGFIGTRLCEYIDDSSVSVVKVFRNASSVSEQSHYWLTSSIDSTTDWTGAFDGIDCVVHCAALVHQMKGSTAGTLEAYRETNTRGTLNLARQAGQAGVKRLVFICSIEVNGEHTEPNAPFVPDLAQVPNDPYGVSKYEAEVQLQQLAKETGLEVVIIRPPLVYGPGVKANFLSILRYVDRKIPLPFGAIHNKRSLVYIDNLIDLIVTCCSHPNASGHTFLVSDNKDVSTTELLKALSQAMDKPTYLAPVPVVVIELLAKLVGKPHLHRRICGSLQVDISKTTQVLSWLPPVSFEEGIRKTIDSYLDRKVTRLGDFY